MVRPRNSCIIDRFINVAVADGIVCSINILIFVKDAVSGNGCLVNAGIELLRRLRCWRFAGRAR